MSKLEAPRAGPQRLRARRWDAIVLGSALPGLIAATRLALGKKRVLLVEEENAARLPTAIREPFVIPLCEDGPLDRCLRALGLPLIDRRRLLPAETAYQVLLPGVRCDVGEAALTAAELVAWGLAKPELAQTWVEQLGAAAQREREQLLAQPFVRFGGLRDFARGVVRSRNDGGTDPLAALRSSSASLRRWADCQVSALRGTADGPLPPAAQIRLLAAALEGCALFASGEESLTGLFRSRFQALHGEIRLVSDPFELVASDGAAAVHPRHSSELWVGRALILNAPSFALRRWILESGGAEPDFLPQPPSVRRRLNLRLEARREDLPEGMARRLIDATDSSEGAEPLRIAWNPGQKDGTAEITLSTVAAEALGDPARSTLEARMVEQVQALLPFAEQRLRPLPLPPTPQWDDPTLLENPEPGCAWPSEISLRLISRPPVYRLPREASAVLGTEGDCLLGWRAGESILGELG